MEDKDKAIEIMKAAMEKEKAKILQSGVSSVEFNKFGPILESLGLKEE